MNRLIRYANVEDSEALGKIHSEAAHEGFKGIIPNYILNDTFSAERRTKRFISELSEGVPKTAIIFEGNEPAGLISFGKCRYGNNDESWIEIWRVYVSPKFWGNGASKELMEWGISEILKEGYKKIELWVLEENKRARKLYEKMGFKYSNTFQLINMDKEIKELRYSRVEE